MIRKNPDTPKGWTPVLSKAINILKREIEGLKATVFLKKIMNLRNRKRFATNLVATFAVLATLSVIVIVIALYGYFDKQVESEFRKKILAEKGQVEIILNNRISRISNMLKDLGADNIIRVTVMLDGKSQLEERIAEVYPSRQGVYFFVKKHNDMAVTPQTYPDVSQSLIDFALKRYPYGEILEDNGESLSPLRLRSPACSSRRHSRRCPARSARACACLAAYG